MALDQQRTASGTAAGDAKEQSPQPEALLQNLRRKLDDLEDKVQACRHQMAAEFQRYYQETLLDAAVPHETKQAVSSTLAASLKDCYPILAVELEKQLWLFDDKARSGVQVLHKTADSLELPSRPEQNVASASASASADLRRSPPSRAAVFGAAVASPGSPHEREKEFQGLFTPFFLPLLDQTPVSPSNPPISPPSQPQSDTTGARSSLAEPGVSGTGVGSGVCADVDTAMQGSSEHLQGQAMEGSSATGGLPMHTGSNGTSQQASPSPLPGRLPTRTRRSTDDTLSSALSSALSDTSQPAIPKSALRRSSSCSRPSQQSPRRVRFEVKGAEVLPTASPQPSDFPTPRPSSPTRADQPRTFDEIVRDSNSSEDTERPSLGRKISSTEKLRLLSREPLDEGTTWTVVNRNYEDAGDLSSAASSMSSKTTSPASGLAQAAPEPATEPGIGVTPQVARKDDESEESSDEDFLAMAKPKSKTKKEVSTPTANQAPRPEPPAAPSTTAQKLAKEEEEKDQTSSEDYEDEDDMFHFESGGLSAPPKPKKRPPPPKDDAPEPATPEPEINEPVRTPQIASPGVSILNTQTSSGPSTPTASRFQIGSLGSYKGRSINMPVVKNPALHAQAEEQGDFNSFVGGVDGRSGVDDADMSSFRASLAQTNNFSGTPRSLSERMMMEDAMEERQKNKEKSQENGTR